MLKQLVTLAVALLLITSFVSALTINDVQTSVNQSSTDIATLKSEMNSKFAQLDDKVSKFATKDDVQKLLQAHLIVTNQLLDQYRSMLFVGFILIGGALIGVAFGIFFYFKSKGRL